MTGLLRPRSGWPLGHWKVRPFILSSGRCLCHGSHPNAVESLGVVRNNFCIVKNLDFVFEIFSYSGINRF